VIFEGYVAITIVIATPDPSPVRAIPATSDWLPGSKYRHFASSSERN
jgi:hypothetical protein